MKDDELVLLQLKSPSFHFYQQLPFVLFLWKLFFGKVKEMMQQ
jgi:hypothetical protein